MILRILTALILAQGFVVARIVCADDPMPSEEEIGHVQVLSDDRQALEEMFGAIDSVSCDTLAVDSILRSRLESMLARTVSDSAFVIYTPQAGGECLGLGIIAEEQGKYRPITFMAGVRPNGRILDVRVLVYRESRGGEVRRSRFLRQYRDKSMEDPIRINRDIINITGATISVIALNHGVRKTLALAGLLGWCRGETP